jgi:uncharacterized protein YuzE
MSDSLPLVTRTEHSIQVVFSESKPSFTEGFECAFDIDDFGTLIGIEIIGLKEQAGIVRAPSTKQTNSFQWSYDKEYDLLSILLESVKYPVRTKTSTGTLFLDQNRSVIGIEIAYRE